MYLNYYSKIRNSLNPEFNIDKEIAQNKNRIVTKEITEAKYHQNVIKILGKTKSIQRLVQDYMGINNATLANKYTTFKIPKASGGFRTIKAPDEDLKYIQQIIITLFEKTFRMLPHNAAHAYMKKRNTLSELKVHQDNKSRWFLKLDIKDFFNCCIEPLVVNALLNMYPIPIFLQKEDDLKKLISPCFLDGALPQGAPSSPFLSNMVMVHTDYLITKALPTLTYTRYADDMLFSSPTHFDWRFVIGVVQNALPPNMQLNKTKIRYSSCNGANWNVGLMYNKDLNITVGYKNKKHIKNMIHNYYKTNEPTTKLNPELIGLLNYYKFIEPEYFNNLIKKYQALGYNI